MAEAERSALPEGSRAVPEGLAVARAVALAEPVGWRGEGVGPREGLVALPTALRVGASGEGEGLAVAVPPPSPPPAPLAVVLAEEEGGPEGEWAALTEALAEKEALALAPKERVGAQEGWVGVAPREALALGVVLRESEGWALGEGVALASGEALAALLWLPEALPSAGEALEPMLGLALNAHCVTLAAALAVGHCVALTLAPALTPAEAVITQAVYVAKKV